MTDGQTRRRELSEGLRKLLRRARRDGWDDAATEAENRGLITRPQAVELRAANPNKGVFG